MKIIPASIQEIMPCYYSQRMPCKLNVLIQFWVKFLSKPFKTHWGRAMHICVIKLTIIGSDNGLSPGRRQAIIWTDAGILLIRSLATNFSEILGNIHSFSFKKMHLKMSSAKGRLFSLGLNELNSSWSPLIYWGLTKMGDIFKCTLLKANCIFVRIWHICSLIVSLAISQHWFR